MSVTIGMEEQIFNLRFQRFSSIISEDAPVVKIEGSFFKEKNNSGPLPLCMDSCVVIC
jgi:hypothetical protein